MAVHEQEKHQNLKIDYYSFVSRQRLKVNSCLFLLSLPTQTLSTSTSLCVTCVIDRLHTFCESDSIAVFFYPRIFQSLTSSILCLLQTCQVWLLLLGLKYCGSSFPVSMVYKSHDNQLLLYHSTHDSCR